MTIYIGLLRGINVGGHNKIKMADLRSLLEGMGLQAVKTYIQSGNVLFKSEEEAVTLCNRIEERIKDHFGLIVPVVLRKLEEWISIIENCPFSNEGLGEGESVQTAFLKAIPSEVSIARLRDSYSGPDEYKIEGMNVYLFFRQSIRNSKLATQLPKLGEATVRNWNTVLKLAEMAKEL